MNSMMSLILDKIRAWWNGRKWRTEYLGQQKRSTPQGYRDLGRYRISSTQVHDDDERWDRYHREATECVHGKPLNVRCSACYVIQQNPMEWPSNDIMERAKRAAREARHLQKESE